MMWLSFVVGILVGLAFVVVGALLVQRSAKGPGFLLIGAGALELLANCCVRGVSSFGDGGSGIDPMRVFQASILGFTCTDVIVVGLLVAALIGLSRALREAPPPPE